MNGYYTKYFTRGLLITFTFVIALTINLVG